MSTWESQLGTAAFSLNNGGTAGTIYMYIITAIGFTLAIISMAEMASMAPTTGGQYHWVSELAPPNAQKFLSYMIGWLCVLGWQAGIASSCFLAGTEIQGLIILNNENFYDGVALGLTQRWQGTLLTFAIITICFLFNTVLVRHLPIIEAAVLFLHIGGWLAIVIVLWVTAEHTPSYQIWTQFNDGGNWGSNGLSTLVGILGPVVSLIGPDAAAHMSEELRNASKSLPRAMAATAIFNGSLGFVMLITFLYCIGDIATVTATPTGYPFIQVFYDATGSTKAATAMTSILILLSTFCAITNVAAASRQLWSFARDRGLPFSGTLSKVCNLHSEKQISIPLCSHYPIFQFFCSDLL
jgi:choline transport protein